ncbi:hypothetical protein ACWGPD_14455 [Streptomyces hirsutus]|uniref:hypothetical protein n=1 Tax=Streptomyces hirsutus TaxID=35620 RepID=UPI0033201E5A
MYEFATFQEARFFRRSVTGAKKHPWKAWASLELIGPLSPRTAFLTHAVGTAEQIQRLIEAGHRPSGSAWQLLRQFAGNIPGALDSERVEPVRVISAARTEAAVHQVSDIADRRAAATRAWSRLNDVEQLFGTAPHSTGS